MKKLLAILMTFVLCFGVLSFAFASENGEVTATVPDGYTGIYTAEDLDNIRNNLSGKYILMNDIDLSSYENWTPIGTSETPFTGALDGNGYAVENLTIVGEYANTINAGLFGYIEKSTVKNLTIENSKIDVTAVNGINAGLLCATSNNSLILNCKTSGLINTETGDYSLIGGVVGSSRSDTIGISQIKNCTNYADVNAKAHGKKSNNNFDSFAVGGIAGYASTEIRECSNNGSIAATETEGEKTYYSVLAGGIVGSQHENLKNCYNTGNVSAVGYGSIASGGIAGGRLAHYEFSSAYNIGKITSKNISGKEFCYEYGGAILGMEDTLVYADDEEASEEHLPVTYINSCYYLDNMENSAPFSDVYTEENVKRLTGEEFKNKDSFVGFDFENIWEMDEELGRPVLREKSDAEPPSTDPVSDPSEKCLFNVILNKIAEFFKWIFTLICPD